MQPVAAAHPIGRSGSPYIEQKLAAGDLRDQGETTRAGRRVRVLTGETERSDGKNVFSRTRI